MLSIPAYTVEGADIAIGNAVLSENTRAQTAESQLRQQLEEVANDQAPIDPTLLFENAMA